MHAAWVTPAEAASLLSRHAPSAGQAENHDVRGMPRPWPVLRLKLSIGYSLLGC